MEPKVIKLHPSSVVALAIGLMVALAPAIALPSPSTVSDPINEQLGLIKKLEGSTNKASYADALYDLAIRYNNIGNFEEARTYFEKALAIEQTLARPEKEYETRVQVARAYLYMKDTETSREKYREAIEFAQAHKLAGIAVSVTGIAASLLQVGKIKAAEKQYRDGIAACLPSESAFKATLERGLAQLCAATDRYDEALTLQTDAIARLSKDGDEGDYGAAMVELADLQTLSGKPLQGHQTLEEVRKKFNPDLFPEVFARTELSE